MAPSGQKRKVDYNAPGTPAQARKRQKGKDARTIPTQTADAALSTTGELNISSFVKAREFEIAALQQSMKKSRKSLTQRAFQQVPRHMRRRTASHNVKKIPRRLRAKALREIKEDNTPTGNARDKKLSAKLRLRLETAKRLQRLKAKKKSVRQRKKEAKSNVKEKDPSKHVEIERVPRIKKNKLVVPPQATSKFKRRQVNKTWLPTHLWHTKRTHITRPTLPLWRMAIPLRPTEKSYRPTHRAAGPRGCIAWDTSYVSTVGCQGTQHALESMLKALGFSGERWVGARYKRWTTGTRHSEDWVFEKDGKRPIAPVVVLWQVKSTLQDTPLAPESSNVDEDDDTASKAVRHKRVKLDRRLFVRVHPSAFHQLWKELLRVAKLQKPQVLLEDLRFELGSITIQGPQSTEARVGVLNLAPEQSHVDNLWSMFSAVNNPATLPVNSLLAFNILDPRLEHPPRQKPVRRDEEGLDKLNEMTVSWPLDNTLPSSPIFDHKTRYRVTKTMPSQKSINRRRAALLPGQQIVLLGKDPRIPVIILAHRSPHLGSNAQGRWTMLLPWGCVDPVWRSLMYYPLSTGSTPRFGGLEQTQQVAFEQRVPWFPGDFPATEAGKSWDRTESENRFDKWIRRPPSKRYAWDALDLGLGRKGELGRGWACDWEFLFRDSALPARLDNRKGTDQAGTNPSKSRQSQLLTQRQRKVAAATVEKEQEDQARRRNSSSPESEDEPQTVHNDLEFDQVPPSRAASLLGSYQRTSVSSKPALATIRVRLLTRGTPAPGARIYRLPSAHSVETKADRPVHQSSMSPPIESPSILFGTTPSNLLTAATLRQRWLDLDPNPQSQQSNPKSSTSLPINLGAQRTSHTGEPTVHRAYDPRHTRDLSQIRVFPPRETKPEVLNMFGPRPPPRTEQDTLKILQPQLVPKMVVNADGDLVVEELWDKHVPCPGPENLIGYATSGGYNLVEGRGTAIGAIWAQRVVEGWREEDQRDAAAGAGAGVESDASMARQTQSQSHRPNDRNGAKSAGKSASRKGEPKQTREQIEQARAEKQRRARIDRERHLCVIRNAGESVGRLAIWELC